VSVLTFYAFTFRFCIGPLPIKHQPCAEHRRFLSDRSRSCAGSNRPSSQLTVWTCSQTSRGHTCPPSLAVPHRSVTRSPSRLELVRCPVRPRNRWLDKLCRDSSIGLPPADLWRRAVTGGHSGVTLRSYVTCHPTQVNTLP